MTRCADRKVLDRRAYQPRPRHVLRPTLQPRDDAAVHPRNAHGLLARAGGPTLQLNPRLLYVALHIAARDKRIPDQAWRALEPGRKELRLPLGDDALMREAAEHVQAMKLSQRATRAYVGSLRQTTKAAAELSDAERASVRRDVEALQKWSTEMLRLLRRAR